MRREFLLALGREILARKRSGQPLKVGIDGRCAAGKTTFADELGEVLRALQPGLAILRPSVDGFHHPRAHRYRQGENSAIGYYEDAFDYDAVVRLLLEPLSGSTFPVECHQIVHDWRTDLATTEPPLFVGADSVLLFEGLFLFRKELNQHWDFRILLDIDEATSVDRAVGRDGDVRDKYRVRYEPAWKIYQAAEDPDAKADIIIDNRDFNAPRRTKP